MNPYAIIDKYYPLDNELKHILVTHSRSVTAKALAGEIKFKTPNFDLLIEACRTTSVAPSDWP